MARAELSPTARAYWDKATAFVKAGAADPKNPPWFELRLGDRALWAWADYFLRHLGWKPAALAYLESRTVDRIIVPSEEPDWFDPSYVPAHTLRRWPPPDKESIAPARRPASAGDFANVLVLREAPQYAAMCERAQHADRREWRGDAAGRGIWVSQTWLKTERGPKGVGTALQRANERFRSAPVPAQEAAE